MDRAEDDIALTVYASGTAGVPKVTELTHAEQAEAIRRLTERGKSLRQIAEQLATTTRTVSRRRGTASAA